MTASPDSAPRRRGIVKMVLGAALLGTLFALSYVLPLQDWLLGAMEWLEGFGVWGLVAVSAFYLVACVAMVPGSILSLGAGFLAGLLWPDAPALAILWGTVAVSIGSVSGATVAFMLGRRFFREAVAVKTAGSPKFAAMDRAIGRDGLKMVILIRLSPAFPFNLLNYAMGLTRVRLRDYILGFWAGMLPGTVMWVYLGTTITSLTAVAAGSGPVAEVGWGRMVLMGLGLVATIVLVVVVTRIARRALREAAGDEIVGNGTDAEPE